TWNGMDWYRNDGERMMSDDWCTPWAKAIGLYLNGSSMQTPDDDFYIAFNSHSQPLQFTIPHALGRFWRVVIHTTPYQTTVFKRVPKGVLFTVDAHSLLVLTNVSA